MHICLIYSLLLLVLSLFLFISGIFFLMNEIVYFIEWELMSLNSVNIVMTFLFDWMSLMFMSLVLYISSMVIFYSKGYMESDIYIDRFIILVMMFVLSMMFLIISPNLISILLGWDGLGLVSYCLVIYYQNVKSANAGMLTILSNRIGDVMILMAIAWMMNYGGWNYIYYLNFMSSDNDMFYIMIFLMIAALTKSAQIPFSSWLPAAMAAPTPVSALVHSSTLVTAGVYLMIRFSDLLIMNSSIIKMLLLISGLTMFMAGLGANFEFDLKKIIALSTLSQLGLMMSTIGMGLKLLAFFHLLTHALFKALLFMCAGSYIHNMNNSQDIRLMGGVSKIFPFTTMCFSIANLALCGFPFLTGFYSKDLILEFILMDSINLISFLLFFLSTGLTVMYSFRLIYYLFMSEFQNFSVLFISEISNSMLLGMMGLVFLGIMGGSMLSWVLIQDIYMIFMPMYLKLLTLVVVILGAWMGVFLMNKLLSFNIFSINNLIFNYLGLMWFMPFLSVFFLNLIVFKLGYKLLKVLDLGWSEMFGGQGSFSMLVKNSKFLMEMQNNYLLMFFSGVFIFLIFILMMLI